MLIVILSDSALSIIDAAVSTAPRNAAGAASALASNSILMFIAPGENHTLAPASKPSTHLQPKSAGLCHGSLRQHNQLWMSDPLRQCTGFESDSSRCASGAGGARHKALREARAAWSQVKSVGL